MYFCFLCQFEAESVHILFDHFRNDHFLIQDDELKLECRNCCRNEYHTFDGFRKHLKKIVFDPSSAQPIPELLTVADSLGVEEEAMEIAEENDNDNLSTKSDASDASDASYELPLFNINKDKVINYTKFLYSLKLPDSTITKVIEGATVFFFSMFDEIVSLENLSDRQNVAEQYKSYLENQISKHNREKIFKDTIKPIRKAHGIRTDRKFDKEMQLYKSVVVTRTFSYVSILETINFLFKNNIEKYFVKEKQNDDLEHFHDGLLYKNSEFFKNNKNAVELQLYFDEFEVCNPLSSRKGVHELGGFYFCLNNLPFGLNSVLENIHLVALCHKSDIKKFGINPVLEVIVQDLKILETDGIYVENLNLFIKGALVSLTYDNLGGASCLGMFESFNSTYYCRICTMTKTQARKASLADDSLLRSADFFRTCSDMMQYANGEYLNFYGIRSTSPFFKLNNFDPCTNFTIDAMHDCLEGVCQRDLKLLFQHCVNSKICTLEEINSLVQAYSFNMQDRANFPSLIQLKSGSSIGQKACQTWCLIVNIPFILKDFLNFLKDTNIWKVVLLIIKIVKISLSPRISKNMLLELQNSIKTHHELLLLEYNLNLTPKDHFLIHYPLIIKRMGPPRTFWTTRYESKNGYFKDLAQKEKNFIDISFTLAKYHQKVMSVAWENQLFLKFKPTLKNSDLCELRCSEYSEVIIELLNIKSNAFIYVGNKIEMKCCTLLKNYFFCEGVLDDLPKFCKCLYFFSYDSVLYVLYEKWKTLGISEACIGYKVEKFLNNSGNVTLSLLPVQNIGYTKCYELNNFEKDFVIITDCFL